MNDISKRVIIIMWKFLVFVVAFFPFLIYDIYKGILTGIRLGRLDFENEVVERKDAIQRELFILSSYPKIDPSEVLKNGKSGY